MLIPTLFIFCLNSLEVWSEFHKDTSSLLVENIMSSSESDSHQQEMIKRFIKEDGTNEGPPLRQSTFTGGGRGKAPPTNRSTTNRPTTNDQRPPTTKTIKKPPPRLPPFAFAVGGRRVDPAQDDTGVSLDDSDQMEPEMGRSMKKPESIPSAIETGHRSQGMSSGDDTDGAKLGIALDTAANLCALQEEFDATGVPPRNSVPAKGSKYMEKYKVKGNHGCHLFKWTPCRTPGVIGKPCGWYELTAC